MSKLEDNCEAMAVLYECLAKLAADYRRRVAVTVRDMLDMIAADERSEQTATQSGTPEWGHFPSEKPENGPKK